MPFGGLLTLGLVAGGSSIFSGILGSKASGKASQQQQQSADQALDFEKQVYGDQRRDQQPYQDLGTAAIAQLMKRIGQAPAEFQAPTLEEARNSPGYQFAKQEGEGGILKAQAASGGAITGGTGRALNQFDTGLADSTYTNVFNRSLQTYDARLRGDAQSFSQLMQPALLGESATAQIGNVGSNASRGIADLMTGKGNAAAAGTIGSANSWTGALGGLSDTASSTLLLSELMKNNKKLVGG